MKRKKKAAPKVSATQRLLDMPGVQKRRLALKATLAVGVLGVAAGAISGYDQQKRELHDLSAIGAGKPVVVQIHDTSCSICRQLKSRALSVFEDDESVDFRLADIFTDEGRALQQQYGVQKTTLLLFNAKGRHVHTVVGLQSIDELKALAARYFVQPA